MKVSSEIHLIQPSLLALFPLNFFEVVQLAFFPFCARSVLESGSEFYLYVSLASFKLKYFHNLSLSVVTLTILKKTDLSPYWDILHSESI
jgi:hypothetical protein